MTCGVRAFVVCAPPLFCFWQLRAKLARSAGFGEAPQQADFHRLAARSGL